MSLISRLSWSFRQSTAVAVLMLNMAVVAVPGCAPRLVGEDTSFFDTQLYGNSDVPRTIMAGAKKTREAITADGWRFLTDNRTKTGVIETLSGLQYQVLIPSTGQQPNPADSITVTYAGMLLDGTPFTTPDQAATPATYRVDQVSKGWNEVVQLMHEGERCRVWIPSPLTRGRNGEKPSSILGRSSDMMENSVLIYDIQLRRVEHQVMAYGWNVGPSPNYPHMNHLAILLKDESILVLQGGESPVHLLGFGGPRFGEKSTRPVQSERYDPLHKRWSDIASMLQSRTRGTFTATCLTDGKVLVVGGTSDPGAVLASCELFDPDIGSWKQTAALSHARAGHLATLLPNGKVLIVDGWTSYDLRLQPCLDGELYDPEHGTWNAAASMKAHHSALRSLPSGKVLAFGNNACELYDPIANDWIRTGSMLNEYHGDYHGDCAATLSDGSVLSSASSTWETYNPHTGAWSITSPLPNPNKHGECVLAALPSGHALAIGGVLNGWLTNTCCEYDPAQDSWSPAAAMKVARMDFSATVLTSGQIVVVDQSFHASPIETYVPPPIELKKLRDFDL